jgi:hypothetical protein
VNFLWTPALDTDGLLRVEPRFPLKQSGASVQFPPGSTSTTVQLEPGEYSWDIVDSEGNMLLQYTDFTVLDVLSASLAKNYVKQILRARGFASKVTRSLRERCSSQSLFRVYCRFSPSLSRLSTTRIRDHCVFRGPIRRQPVLQAYGADPTGPLSIQPTSYRTMQVELPVYRYERRQSCGG